MAHLLTRIFRRRDLKCTVLPCVFRMQHASTCGSSRFTSVLLKGKAHVEVSGRDSVKFLNGLVTNDVNLFHCDSQMLTLYCMILNAKGRVLYDLILYKLKNDVDTPGFLLECDSGAAPKIINTLKPYKLRSQVELKDVSQRFCSWAVIHEGAHQKMKRSNSDGSDSVILVEDPRLSCLGARLVLATPDTPSKYYDNIKEVMDQSAYELHRLKHGVSEGLNDIEPGVALPLEYNITELHGVSYQKGCYVGQELTARTYHTGVVRKRIMPVKLASNAGADLSFEKNAPIKTNSGKTAGSLKNVYGSVGLGLMRLDVVKSAGGLSVFSSDGTNVTCTVDWPAWWIPD